MLENADGCTCIAQSYGHTFYPLVVLFSKQHETTESVTMAMNALDQVCMDFFGSSMKHKAFCIDHTDGLLNGMRAERPDLPVGNCWAHIARARMHLNAPDYVTLAR